MVGDNEVGADRGDIILAEEIKSVLDNLCGLNEEEAKNAYRRIFSRLNFKSALDPIPLRLKDGKEYMELKGEVIASSRPTLGEPFRIIYLTAPKLTKTLRRSIIR